MANEQESQHAHEHGGDQQVVVPGHLADHDDGGNRHVGCCGEEARHADHGERARIRDQRGHPLMEHQPNGSAERAADDHGRAEHAATARQSRR